MASTNNKPSPTVLVAGAVAAAAAVGSLVFLSRKGTASLSEEKKYEVVFSPTTATLRKQGKGPNSVMPLAGLGFWKVPKSDCAKLVEDAVKAGWCHFDNACDYGNEKEVGAGLASVIKSGLVKREELFVTGKLWNTYHRAEHVRAACKRTLADLGLQYLDLFLIHFPIAQKFVPFETRYPPEWFFDPNAPNKHVELDAVPIIETWRAMEALVEEGLVKNIGVANFNTSLLRDLLNSAKIKPAVNQVEIHPFNTQDRLLRFCKSEGVLVTGFSPLGSGSYEVLNPSLKKEDNVLTHPVVANIAKKHKKSAAQVVLRWGVQRGASIVPKTTKPERLKENLAIFDFSLSAEEMAAISKLNQNRRFNDPGDFCEGAFNTFIPIYE